ncbi:hypothetical protein SDC9_67012 [bioreactor metagenome]|uniref:Uncharacterized protein n=1 Tax=bioreactor metagenome TaxID=1076179 RepID=A0A644XY43_9ZZZZ
MNHYFAVRFIFIVENDSSFFRFDFHEFKNIFHQSRKVKIGKIHFHGAAFQPGDFIQIVDDGNKPLNVFGSALQIFYIDFVIL